MAPMAGSTTSPPKHEKAGVAETSALCVAARQGDIEEVRTLLDAGSNPSGCCSDDLNTAFMLASIVGSCEIIEELLLHGADVDYVDLKGNTALLYAIQKGKRAVVITLLDHGASPNLSNRDMRTPLMFAVEHYCPVTMGLLIEAGALVDSQDSNGRTALMEASRSGKWEGLDTLLRAGADTTRRDRDGRGLIEYCFQDNNFHGNGRSKFVMECVELYLQKVFKDNLPIGEEIYQAIGTSSINILMWACQFNKASLVDTLLDIGYDLERTDSSNSSALIIASKHNNLGIVSKLIAHGAHIDHRDGERNTALCIAAEKDHTDIVQTLINNGADLNPVNSAKCTPVMLAAGKNSHNSLSVLLKAGALLDCQDENGKTALMFSCSTYNSMSLKLLLEAGADFRIQDRDGHTALTAALQDPVLTSSRMRKQALVSHILSQGMPLGSDFHLLILYNRDWDLVYKAIQENVVVPSLEQFPENLLPRGLSHFANQGLTPLACALLVKNFCLARFFISNWFLHEQDLTLSVGGVERAQDYFKARRAFLQSLYSQPWSLRSLSYIQASTSLGFGETRPDRVERCGLPPLMQRWLLYQTPEWKMSPSTASRVLDIP